MHLSLFIPLADASVVNGGAIDGFLRPLAINHILAVLAVGFYCSQIAPRPALIGLLAFFGALLAGLALPVLGMVLPQAGLAFVLLALLMAACVILSRRVPWQAGLAVAVALAIALAGTTAPSLEFKSTAFQASFIVTFALVCLGLSWAGLAIGFAASNSRSGVMLLRVAGLGAGVLGAAALAGLV